MEAPRIRRYTRFAREPLLTSHLRGNPENRFWAKVIDVLVVEAIIFIFHVFFAHAHLIVPYIAWAGFDTIGRGQSPGKWLLGLHTIEGHQGRKPNAFQSLARNLPAALASMSLGFTGFWQWAWLLPIVAWVSLEVYFVFNLRSGIRVGDIFANTRVFDYKDEHTQFIEQFLKEPDL